VSTNPVYLGLGSNVGNRSSALRQALRQLAREGMGLRRSSSVYDTDPVGFRAQPSFLNLVVEAIWGGSPEELLGKCLETEQLLGRVRRVKDGPRRIDIDILLMDGILRNDPNLVIPHPRMHLRRFVLVPLSEIAPRALHPVLGMRVSELLERCEDASGVRKAAGPLKVVPPDLPRYNPPASRGKRA
jgi:2-amino-4-hydroxy-6-hydroxymethyldihydropteridine diphosphokinase